MKKETQGGIKLKKFLKSTLMGLAITMIFVTPTFAAPDSGNYHPIKGEKIVAKGDGYTIVTRHDDGKKKSNKTGGTKIQPNSTKYFTMSQGGSGSYSGTTIKPYSDGNLTDYSFIHATDEHYLTASDKFYAYGHQYVDWSGSKPNFADEFTLAPSETISASQNVLGVSIPGGASVTPWSSTVTLNWISHTIPNDYTIDYYWDQWDVQSGGKFMSVSTNDQVSWRFGSTIIGELNTVVINLS